MEANKTLDTRDLAKQSPVASKAGLAHFLEQYQEARLRQELEEAEAVAQIILSEAPNLAPAPAFGGDSEAARKALKLTGNRRTTGSLAETG